MCVGCIASICLQKPSLNEGFIPFCYSAGQGISALELRKKNYLKHKKNCPAVSSFKVTCSWSLSFCLNEVCFVRYENTLKHGQTGRGHQTADMPGERRSAHKRRQHLNLADTVVSKQPEC